MILIISLVVMVVTDNTHNVTPINLKKLQNLTHLRERISVVLIAELFFVTPGQCYFRNEQIKLKS